MTNRAFRIAAIVACLKRGSGPGPWVTNTGLVQAGGGYRYGAPVHTLNKRFYETKGKAGLPIEVRKASEDGAKWEYRWNPNFKWRPKPKCPTCLRALRTKV